MIENSKVMIRIEYERNGTRRVLYGEIGESKLEAFHTGEGSFIYLLNDGKMTWIDKEAILSVYKLETKSRVYKKDFERWTLPKSLFSYQRRIKNM